MARKNYTEILDRLGGLNLDELRSLQKRIDYLIEAETNYSGPRFIERDPRCIEIKCIKTKRKDGTQGPPRYGKYFRWRQDGKLKSEYIRSATQEEYEKYRSESRKPKQPAQPKRKAA